MGNSNLGYRKDELEKELYELQTVKDIVEGEQFQKFFALPLQESVDKIKHSYNCKTLIEMHYNKGLFEGLSRVQQIIGEVNMKIKFIKNDLSSL